MDSDNDPLILVLRERIAQFQSGYDSKHDDKFTKGELTDAAMAYATAGRLITLGAKECPFLPEEFWPWNKRLLTASTAEGNYVKAIALLLAELDRLDRARMKPKSDL